MALQFVAEIVEHSFRGGFIFDSITSIASRFAKKSGLEPRHLNKLADDIDTVTYFETLLLCSESPETASSGVKSHARLSSFENIGGDLCILNTQKLAHWFMGDLKGETIPSPSLYWGPPFDESKSPARRIRGDLDAPFASTILPEILEACRDLDIVHLPDRAHLITVLDLMQRHVNGDVTKPVPIALSFGLHAILMSIFLLQGDDDLARVASYTSQSYSMLFEQWQTVSDGSKPSQNTSEFHKALDYFVGVLPIVVQIRL